MNLIKKYKYLILPIIVIIIILSYLYYNSNQEHIEDESTDEVLDVATLVDTISNPKTLKVDIKGAIKKPGVYEIIEGSRVIDVVGVSGGFNYNAYTSNINLSKILKDEDVIIIYTKEEIDNLKKDNIIIEYIEKECPIIECKENDCNCPTVENVGCIKEENTVTSVDSINKQNKLINLNTATKEELMSLSSIGESKANLIIEYRNNTKFKSIDELKNVKGIGDSIYEKIKDLIEV